MMCRFSLLLRLFQVFLPQDEGRTDDVPRRYLWDSDRNFFLIAQQEKNLFSVSVDSSWNWGCWENTTSAKADTEPLEGKEGWRLKTCSDDKERSEGSLRSLWHICLSLYSVFKPSQFVLMFWIFCIRQKALKKLTLIYHEINSKRGKNFSFVKVSLPSSPRTSCFPWTCNLLWAASNKPAAADSEGKTLFLISLLHWSEFLLLNMKTLFVSSILHQISCKTNKDKMSWGETLCWSLRH